MKLYKLQSLALSALALSPLAHAGDHEHNGGQSVMIGGNVQVRDLVDAEECTWTKGTEFAASLKHFDRVMQVIEERNWLLSDELRIYANKLLVCVSRKALRPIPSEHQDGFSGVQLPGKDQYQYSQAAVRVGDTVYIDGTIFNQMDDVNRAYLLLHEVLHNFVHPRSRGAKDRIHDMRSFVRFVYEIDMQMQNPDAELFQRVLQQYQVYFPTDTLVAHSNSDKLRKSKERCDSIWDSCEIYAFNDFVYPATGGYYWSIVRVENISRGEQTAFLRDALKSGRARIFKKAIEKGFWAAAKDGNPKLPESNCELVNSEQRLFLLKNATTSGCKTEGSFALAIPNYIRNGDRLAFEIADLKLDASLTSNNETPLQVLMGYLHTENDMRFEKMFDFLTITNGIRVTSVSSKACDILERPRHGELEIFRKLYNSPGFDRAITCKYINRSNKKASWMSLVNYAKRYRSEKSPSQGALRTFYDDAIKIMQDSNS